MAGQRGDGRRIGRVERELREVISSYLISGLRQSLPALVSVPQVVASPDLRQAKVYVSVIDPEASPETAEECIELLNQSHAEIQAQIGRQINMKFCPKLRFYRDEVQQAALKVDSLLHEISKQHQGSEDE